MDRHEAAAAAAAAAASDTVGDHATVRDLELREFWNRFAHRLQGAATDIVVMQGLTVFMPAAQIEGASREGPSGLAQMAMSAEGAEAFRNVAYGIKKVLDSFEARLELAGPDGAGRLAVQFAPAEAGMLLLFLLAAAEASDLARESGFAEAVVSVGR